MNSTNPVHEQQIFLHWSQPKIASKYKI